MADDWSTRHSVQRMVRRTAALVNVLGEPGQAPPPPADVETVLREYGEQGELGLSDEDVAGMREAAESLRGVFAAADADTAARRLNRLLGAGLGPLRLTSHGGSTPWHVHLDRDDEAPWPEWFLASSCTALAVLVWDRQRAPGGVCSATSCRSVYADVGRGPARRYCSRRCATRERVAEHRSRSVRRNTQAVKAT